MRTTIFTIGILILVMHSGCEKKPPTDKALQKSFNANRAVFDQLHKMIQSDSAILRIGDDVVGEIWFNTSGASLDDALSAAGMSRKQYEDYVKLLRQIGAYRVSIRIDDDSVSEIGMYRAGNVAESHSADIVFMKRKPTPIVADTLAATRADNTNAYFELGDSWYICRKHD